MKLQWAAPTENTDGTPCEVEFYVVRWWLEGFAAHKDFAQTTEYTPDLSDGHGLYTFEVKACHDSERCSFPLRIQWFHCDHPQAVEIETISRDGDDLVIGWNAEDGYEYWIDATADLGMTWRGVAFVKGNGYTTWRGAPAFYRIIRVPLKPNG